MANKTKIISLEIPDNLRAALKLEAFNRDISLSACVRQILAEYLKVEVDKKDINEATEG